MLRSILEAQDQLERRYISKKEEHRTLEMQNYMGLSRNTGTFDPNRHVEGDIFRIGMHLEDIKEMIDRNVCEPRSSSSTPTSVKDLLDMKPLRMSTPLPLPSLHEVIMSTGLVNLCRFSLVCNTILSGLMCQASSTDFATLHHKMETWKERQNKVTNKVNKNITLQTSSELIISDPSLRNSRCSSSVSRHCKCCWSFDICIYTNKQANSVLAALLCSCLVVFAVLCQCHV